MMKIFEALEVPDTDVKVLVLEILVDLVKFHYEFIELYIKQISIATI